jgi:hypothetical protein
VKKKLQGQKTWSTKKKRIEEEFNFLVLSRMKVAQSSIWNNSSLKMLNQGLISNKSFLGNALIQP